MILVLIIGDFVGKVVLTEYTKIKLEVVEELLLHRTFNLDHYLWNVRLLGPVIIRSKYKSPRWL